MILNAFVIFKDYVSQTVKISKLVFFFIERGWGIPCITNFLYIKSKQNGRKLEENQILVNIFTIIMSHSFMVQNDYAHILCTFTII